MSARAKPLFAVVGLLMLLNSPLLAEAPVGRITARRGAVTLARPGEPAAWSPRVGDGVFLKDTLITGHGSLIKVLFEGDVLVVIGEDSRVEVSEFLYAPKERRRTVLLRLITGRIRSILAALRLENDDVSIISSNAVAGVKGTDFVVEIPEDDLTVVHVLEGTVEVRNADSSVKGVHLVEAGHFSRIAGVGPPKPPSKFPEEHRRHLSETLWLADAARTGTEAGTGKPAIGRKAREAGR